MKILDKNYKKGFVKLQIETLDDLWYLSTIIDPNDLVKGKTLRKIKLNEDHGKSIRKPVFMELKVESIDLSNTLRIKGTITQGPEDIPLGSYHSFNIEEKTIITLSKNHWLKFQKDKLEESEKEKLNPILICILDRENALFSITKKYGFETLLKFSGDVEKKDERITSKGNFYLDIIKKIQEYILRYKIDNVIVASPAFWKEDLMKKINDVSLKRKITLANVSSFDVTSINELLKRPEIQTVMKRDRISKENKLIDLLLKEISLENLAVYGFNETKNAIIAGAVKILLITDSLIKSLREDNKFEQLDILMRSVDEMGGEILILSSSYNPGKKLNGLTGIAGILRYK